MLMQFAWAFFINKNHFADYEIDSHGIIRGISRLRRVYYMSEKIELKVYPVIVPVKSALKSYNFYLVENASQLFLIDAGVDTESCWEAFVGVLREAGFVLEDIDFIVLTHHHADHIGLVNRIRACHKVPIYAHEKAFLRLKRDAVFLEKRIVFFNKLYHENGCGLTGEQQVDKLKAAFDKNKSQTINGSIHSLQEGDYIGGLRVVELPGHAPDQIGLLEEGTGVFFVGDHIIKHLSTNALIDMDEAGTKIPALLIYEKTLKKCLNYPLRTLYSGHGIVIEDGLETIVDKLNRIEKKSEKILLLIKHKQTAAEIAQKMYKVYYKQIFSLVMSEVIGHCDRLIATGQVEQIDEKGINYYIRKSIE